LGYYPRPLAIRSAAVEARDLTVSWLVISLCFSIPYLLAGDTHGVAASFIAVGTGFILHELAHRTVARSMGLIAGYRAWWGGLLLALTIAVLTTAVLRTTIVFAAPGAVIIYSPWSGAEALYASYLISIAGPLTNAGIAIASWILSRVLPPLPGYYAYVTAYVNAVLALFNSIPIPPLDGYKVLRYSVTHWALLMALTIVVYVVVG